jgi:hypothetical protein
MVGTMPISTKALAKASRFGFNSVARLNILQEAVADGLEYELSVYDNHDECYLFSLATELKPKRDALAKALVGL